MCVCARPPPPAACLVATLVEGGAIVGAPESNPENPPYPTGPMIALLVVGASAFRAPASHMSRRAALTGVASAGLATAVPANAAYSGGSDFGKTPAERGEISRAELEADVKAFFSEYIKAVQAGSITSQDYLSSATVVDGRIKSAKPAFAQGADEAAKQFNSISTKGATVQVVSVQGEEGGSYRDGYGALINYLVTPLDGKPYRGVQRIAKLPGGPGESKWQIDFDCFPLDNAKVYITMQPTRDIYGRVTMALDKKFR